MANKLQKIVFCALVMLFSYNISAQTSYTSLFTADNSTSRPSWLENAVEGAVMLNIDKQQLEKIINLKEDRISLSIPVESGSPLSINLERFRIFDESSKIVAGTDNGDVEINVNDKIVSYFGYVDGIDRAMVSITFSNDRVTGLVSSANETFVIGKLNSQNAGKYILYRSSKMKITSPFNCESETLEIPGQINDMQNMIKDNLTNDLRQANIALESDYETFVRFGSVENASVYLLSLMSTVSAVYIRDVNTKIFITYLRVWSTSADPYSGTTSNALLNEFRSYWNANMSGVPRTIAHYVSTRSGNLGGIAWVNVLCQSINSGYGYAFSNINGFYNNLPVYSWDVDVISHEMGHNFGSPHTHNCGWPGGPIDSCYAVEGGCYSGPAIARVGTIMSYCHLNGSKVLLFGPLPTDLIRTSAENAGCMQTISGFFIAKPNGKEIFRSNDTPLIIWGTSTANNVNIEYTSNNGTTWQVVQNNVQGTLRSYTWTLPYIPTTTQAKVRISESGNPAVNDMSDTVFQIRPSFQVFNLLSPQPFERVYVSPNDTSRIYFYCSKAGTLPEFRYKWLLNTLGNVPIFNQFTNNTGVDTVLSITKGKIDSIITAYGINTGDSLRGRWLIKSYTQLDSANPTASGYQITFIRSLIGINPVSNNVPKEFFVNQNYPNPFNPVTKVKFGVPKSAFVTAKVYDILGKEIQVLANEKVDAGEYEIDWNAESLPSGVYFIRIESAGSVKILRSVLLK